VGLVTKFDFLKAFAFAPTKMVPHYDEIMQTKVADVMTRAVIHVEAEAPLPRALQLMVDLKARSFPVLNEAGKLVGVIAREDIIRALKATATH
ncbi:MAG: HPP family protein, partial [Hyphomicrobiaceae bacterium]